MHDKNDTCLTEPRDQTCGIKYGNMISLENFLVMEIKIHQKE